MEMSPLLIVGAALFNIGGIIVVIVLAKVGGVASWTTAFHNLGRKLYPFDDI